MSTSTKLDAPPVGARVRHTSHWNDGTIVIIQGPIVEHGGRGIVIGKSGLYCAIDDCPGEYTVELEALDDTTAAAAPDAAKPLGQWMIVEQLGHRKMAGHLTEVTIAGAGMLRLDIPPAGDDPGRTQYLSPASVYALHPVGEATARAAARTWRPEPVSPWELRELQGPNHNPPVDAVPTRHEDSEAWYD